MHDTYRRIRFLARPALVWTLVFFLSGHLFLGLYLTHRHPELCDPEFRLHLRNLRARLAEKPDRPLAVALGSSRVLYGLRPESAMEQGGDGAAEPLLFNFSLLGSGPVVERLVLHRLLKMHVKPKWVFLEVWTPFLAQVGCYNEGITVFQRDLYWPDIPLLSRLYHRRREAAARVFTETVAPALHYRMSLLDHCAPYLIPPSLLGSLEGSAILRSHPDGFGWAPLPIDRLGAAEYAARLKEVRTITKPAFEQFKINAISDKSLHGILEECRTHDIRAVLVLMPEHSLLSGWYPPIQAELTAYLRQMSATYRVPVLDARAWCGDDDLPDCYHLSVRGARIFSARFGREVLAPLSHGQPLARDVLLCGPSAP